MGYVTVQEVMEEASGACRSASSTRVSSLIDEYSDMVDLWTGFWFERRDGLTLKLDGKGTPYLHLPAPALAIDEVRYVWSTGATEVLSSDMYKVYNRGGRGQYDDRRNPKLVMVGYDNTIFGVAYGPRLSTEWIQGHQNYEIDGDFGFVDTGDVTPPAIKRAVILLVLAHLPKQGSATACDRKRADNVRSISVAGRSETYGGPTSAGTLSGLEEVDRILWSFRRPPGVAAA